MKPLVVGIGEILWDIFPEQKVLGGAPANFAYHAAQCGCTGCVVSAVGNDVPGQEIITSLKEKNLNHQVEFVNFPTGTVQVSLRENGVPHYEICENVAWDNIPITKQIQDMAQHCAAVCFGTLAQRNHTSRNTILHFLDLVPASSYKIFDINLRQNFYTAEIIHESLVHCNVLKINHEEVLKVAELYKYTHKTEEEVCELLLKKYSLRMVVETKGEEGSYIFTPNETSCLATPKVTVADTVGAGDAFTGALVAALLHGKTIKDAHQLAVEVAAYTCTQLGAMPKLPEAFTILL